MVGQPGPQLLGVGKREDIRLPDHALDANADTDTLPGTWTASSDGEVTRRFLIERVPVTTLRR